jgi:hypothetical protein
MAARRAVLLLLLLCVLSLSTAPLAAAAAAPAAKVPLCRKPANKTFEYYTYRMFWCDACVDMGRFDPLYKAQHTWRHSSPRNRPPPF